VMVMYGAPSVFHGLWMAVVPFIAEETRCGGSCCAGVAEQADDSCFDDMC